MTTNERSRPGLGDRFGRLRVDGHGALCVCAGCQRSIAVDLDDLFSGAVTACPECGGDKRVSRNAGHANRSGKWGYA